jgi:hypothetical protein
VPHSFQNLDDEVAELVVIFPANVWEYDVLDYFPFSTPEAKAIAKAGPRNELTPNTPHKIVGSATCREPARVAACFFEGTRNGQPGLSMSMTSGA